ncbi:hypothetical protein D1007_12539 [Hordeum vulgare]|nr:hypothetical protein D1007_12539 [Hordeum vulgare]
MAASGSSSLTVGWTGKNLEEMLQHLDLKEEELDDVVVGEEELKNLEVAHGGQWLFKWMGLLIKDYNGKTDRESVIFDGLVKDILLTPKLYYKGDYVNSHKGFGG